MINLIPPDAKKRVVIEYWLRVAVVWAWLGIVGVVIIGFSLVPVYVLIHSQIAAYADAYQAAKTNTQSYTGLVAQVNQADSIARQLVNTDNTPYYSNYISHINDLAPASIHIATIKLSWATSSIHTILLNGEADSRADLAQFKDTLSNDPAFSDAALPLSNLAKDKNVPFQITITTK